MTGFLLQLSVLHALPYRDFSPTIAYLLPGSSYLIGISHFPDPGGFGRVPLCPLASCFSLVLFYIMEMEIDYQSARG